MFLVKCIRTLFLSLVLAAAGVAGGAVFSLAHAAKSETFAERGFAAGGYDVVSYFVGDGAPVKGDAALPATYKGATYRFASEANRAKFLEKPAAYAPQYGGYCAWAAAQGYTAPGRPQHYKVVSGKLYLNYDAGVQKKWNKDIPGFITKADANWPKILTK